jgi:uroporphyrin-III C-methyltransferase / precorrin-2 dehydrogenase / sirohydrochlorin ferrochelatase
MRVIPPRETRPARMRPLAVLPVFYDLQGRRVVIVGAGDAATWKAELAAAAGAHVEVYAKERSADLDQLAQAPPAGSVSIVERSWQPHDLAGASLVIGALDGPEAQELAAAARTQGIPVNIVDTPELSTFRFGSVVNRSPIVVGISTAGVAPVLGQAIRARIEAMLHPALGAWGAAARQLRAIINARLPMGAARRAIWRRFADRALTARAEPDDHDLVELARHMPASTQAGSVVLVGAGPGDPELLTLKGLRALQSADVILYDRLVSPEILELARREAKRMLVGKSGGGSYCRQDQINELMVKLAQTGKRVVRLKGGDPLVFGRAAEELEVCRDAGIPVEVVPGITAALGAAAELQIPLTDRRFSQRLQLVTGHAKTGAAPEHDWSSLADAQMTSVFYMGSRTFAGMLPKLLAAGLDPATPAVAIWAATTPRSTTVACPVADLSDALLSASADGPCLIMIGRSVGQRAAPHAGAAVACDALARVPRIG